MDKDINFIDKQDTTVKLIMDGYQVTLNFLPQNNEKIIEQVKAMITSSLADTAHDKNRI